MTSLCCGEDPPEEFHPNRGPAGPPVVPGQVECIDGSVDLPLGVGQSYPVRQKGAAVPLPHGTGRLKEAP
jgi:hypothetical protein